MLKTGRPMFTPELIMLCGIPTSGKSSYVKKLKDLVDYKDVVILSTDNYIEQQAQRLGLTYNQLFVDVIDDATRNLDIEFNMAKENGRSIIWDQTNLTVKTRKKKISRIPSYYRRGIVYFKVSLEEALERNKIREGKFIPEDILKRMYNQFEIPTLDEGFDFVMTPE